MSLIVKICASCLMVTAVVSSSPAQQTNPYKVDQKLIDQGLNMASPSGTWAGVGAAALQPTPTQTQQQEDDSMRQGVIQQQRTQYGGHNAAYDDDN